MMNKKLTIGQKEYSQRIYTTDDVITFAKLSGDYNPVHLDAGYAEKTIFKKPIVHGLFVASQISELIANKLPGPGSIYINQTLQFTRPVFHGEIIKCEVEILLIKEDKNIIELKTICTNNEGLSVIEGTAIVKLIE